MRRCFVVVSLLALIVPGFAQSRHPFRFEDMMKLKRIGEPEVSPDGKWVIFSVVDVDLTANTKTPHVWIVPTAGGKEREIISDQDADRPRWAPDGKRFAFISTKEGGSQVWIADFDDGAGNVTKVHKLSSIATEADGELWSPDGKNILFKSDVYPECDGQPEAAAACNAKKVEETKNSKVKALIFTQLLYRHWNAYREGKWTHLLIVQVDGGAPRDLTPGEYDSPVFSLGGQDDYAFSPDGKEICYTSNHDKIPAASTNNDLWIVPATGGEAKNITADNPASDSTPVYSPDGKYIAYRAQKRPGYESDRFRLMLYDRNTGEKKNLTEDFDSWVESYVWLPDSKSVYFTADKEGYAPIYRMWLDAQPKEIMSGLFADDLTVTPDGSQILFSWMSAQSPTKIWKAQREPAGSIYEGKMSPTLLADPNSELLSQISMSPLEPFWFTGAHGDRVEGFIVKPPNFDPNKKYPLKYIVHGGPQVPVGDEWSYRWNSELFAANGYVVIEINFHGSPGYGQKFIDAINGDWGGAPYEDLMKGLDYAEQHYSFIDKDRECVMGASFGGWMVNWILGHTGRFKCAVTHDGTFNTEADWGTTEEIWFDNWEFRGPVYDNRELYRKWSPHLFVKNFKTPTLVVHGQLDYRVDVSGGLDIFTNLQMLGVPSEMLYFPDEGHWVLKPQNSQLWYKTVNDWVDRWTKK